MAKVLYFQSGPATTHRGVNDTKLAGAASWWDPRLLAETRGAGVATVTAASIAGTTVGIEFVNGALALEWLTEPLSADFTISGTITASLWAFESTMNDNAAINVVIDKIDGATGAITQIAKSARIIELGLTSPAVNNFTVSPTSTACKRGDRIRVRPFIDDIGTAMVVGASTFSFSGPTGSVNGDSYISFAETLTFEAAGVAAVTGPTQTVSDGEEVLGDGFGNDRLSQAFVAIGPVTSVRLRLKKFNTPADALVVEIQSASAADPSGTVIGAVATVSGASLTGTSTEYTWSGLDIPLTPGATYHVVVRRTGAVDGSNFYTLSRSSTAQAGWATMRTFNGTAWAARGTTVMRVTFTTVPSTYYLTDTAETINPGAATEKKALTTRGSGSVTVAASTVAGPTAGVQV